MKNKFQDNVTELLLKAGFIAVGYSPAGPVAKTWSLKLDEWIEKGNNSRLKWMERNTDKRSDPALLHPGTRSVISLLHPLPDMEFDNGPVKIAAYAHGQDYHTFLKQQATPAINLLLSTFPVHKPLFVTDSAAMFDRYWAWKAGLGFIGKNGFMIHSEAGSRVLIAHILTSAEFEYNPETLANRCGNCSNCMDQCPTQAFIGNGTIDTRKCIACYNIESKDETPQHIAKKNPGWIYGCDICQQVCPYNSQPFFSIASEKMKGDWNAPASAHEWLEMTEDEFRRRFSTTPLTRAGLEKIKKTIIQLNI